MNKKQETIICSAVWYKELPTPTFLPINIESGIVFSGHRHPHCISAMTAMTGKRSVTTEVGEYVQGFLTSNNRFVDREEAAIIAIMAEQVKDKEKKTLYSEDLY